MRCLQPQPTAASLCARPLVQCSIRHRSLPLPGSILLLPGLCLCRCGPCRMIGPYFEELSTQFEGVVFLKVRT